MASEFPSKAALFQELLLAVLLVVLLVLHRDLLFKNKKISIKLIGKAILWGLVAIILEIIVIAGFVLFTKTVLPSVNTTKVISIILRNPIFIVYTVIIAPLLEELVFRYSFFNLTVIIYSKLFNRNNQEKHSSVLRWLVCALVTAFMFAGLHADNTVWEYILISVYLQWLFYYYKDIRMSMIAHMVFNLTTLILLLVV